MAFNPKLNLTTLPNGKKEYVNKIQLDLDYQMWIDKDKDDYYFQTVLYSQIQTIMGMLLSKLYPTITPDHYTRREDNNTINSRLISGKIDIDNLVSGMWSVFFEKVVRDFDPTKGTLFSICYKYFFNEARAFYNVNINHAKNIKTYYLEELLTPDEDGNSQIESLDCLTEEPSIPETNNLLDDLRDFANLQFEPPILNWNANLNQRNTVSHFQKIWSDNDSFQIFSKILIDKKHKPSCLIEIYNLYFRQIDYRPNYRLLVELDRKLLIDFGASINKKTRFIYRPWTCETPIKPEFKTRYYRRKRDIDDQGVIRTYGKKYSAFGESKTICQWLKDKHNIHQLTSGGLLRRLTISKMNMEDALSTPRDNSNIVRKNPRKYSAFGEFKSICEWSKDSRCKVDYRKLYGRIKVHGWSLEKAIIP